MRISTRIVARRGLRRGEAVHLRWADVDLEARQPTVGDHLDEEAAWSPKTESGNRTIALDALTVRVLRAQRDTQDAERRLWGRRGPTRAGSSRKRTGRSSMPTPSLSASTGLSRARTCHRCGCTTSDTAL